MKIKVPLSETSEPMSFASVQAAAAVFMCSMLCPGSSSDLPGHEELAGVLFLSSEKGSHGDVLPFTPPCKAEVVVLAGLPVPERLGLIWILRGFFPFTQ